MTRLKDNEACEIVAECQVPQNSNIVSDQIIRLTGEQAKKDYPVELRRVVVWGARAGDPAKIRIDLAPLTN